MIACPYCGTLNRKGSKYCSNCGQRLDTVPGITCPLCDRLNPSDGIVCQFCGAPLVPPVLAVEGDRGVKQPSQKEAVESEPKGPEPSTPPQPELPSWLYQQPAEQPKAPSPPAAVSLSPQAEPSAEEESKGLKGIRGVLPSAEAWLASARKRGVRNPSSASKEAADIKPKPRLGCMPLGLAAVLGIAGLVMLSAL